MTVLHLYKIFYLYHHKTDKVNIEVFNIPKTSRILLLWSMNGLFTTFYIYFCITYILFPARLCFSALQSLLSFKLAPKAVINVGRTNQRNETEYQHKKSFHYIEARPAFLCSNKMKLKCNFNIPFLVTFNQ